LDARMWIPLERGRKNAPNGTRRALTLGHGNYDTLVKRIEILTQGKRGKEGSRRKTKQVVEKV